jgi:hypothetical protein
LKLIVRGPGDHDATERPVSASRRATLLIGPTSSSAFASPSSNVRGAHRDSSLTLGATAAARVTYKPLQAEMTARMLRHTHAAQAEHSVVVPRSIELPQTQTAAPTLPTFGFGPAPASVREVAPDTPAAAPSASTARWGVGSARASVREVAYDTPAAAPSASTARWGVGSARASVREVAPDTPAAAPSASAARWAQPFRFNTNLHPPKLVLPPLPQCDEMTVSERASAFRAWLQDCGQARSEFTKSYDDFTETFKRCVHLNACLQCCQSMAGNQEVCALDRMLTVLSVNGCPGIACDIFSHRLRFLSTAQTCVY